MHFPGFAILCRVEFAQLTPEGQGYFCAVAVPAADAAAAEGIARNYLEVNEGDRLTIEDRRDLNAEEAQGLVAPRLMGRRIYIDETPDGHH